ASMLRTYEPFRCSATTQSVSPSRAFPTGVRLGWPLFRPTVSRIITPGSGMPARAAVLTNGLKGFVDTNVDIRRLSTATAYALSEHVRCSLRPPSGRTWRCPLARQADRGRRQQGDAPGALGAARGRRQLQGGQGVHLGREGAGARAGRAQLAQPGPAG